MAGYIGSDKSGVIVGGYTNSQIDTAISTHAYSKAQVDTLIEAAGAVTVSATEPSSPSEGDLWYDSTTGVKVLKFYNGTAWLKVSSAVPTLTSVSGNLYTGVSTSLTLSGTNFLDSNLVVNFTQASDSIDVDVAVTPTSNTSAAVAVPRSVYDYVTVGNVVSISVTNSDGQEFSAVTKTAYSPPTGGTITTSDGYRYHEFTSSGDFVVSTEITGVDYIVVAAGGGGGGWGGGGGAGGLISQTSQTLSAATYPIVLGAGGYGTGVAGGYRTDAYYVGSDGGDTTFNSLTAIGGGGGGKYDGGVGRAGGSGGGGGGSSVTTLYGVAGGAGTSGQGNNGGRGGGVNTYHNGQGGGGGAGAIGGESAGYGASGGAGGAGLAPTGFSSFGDSGYFAGGGGGHTDRRNGAAVSTGGAGGGGNGGGYQPDTSAQNGDANTGGGGGGSYGRNSSSVSGHGGSGTVIIRYAI